VAITLRDGGDNPLLEPVPGDTPIWPTVILTALFPDTFSADELRESLAPTLPESSLTFEYIGDKDWQAGFEESLDPMQFGQRLWVTPDRSLPLPPDAVAIELSPGLAFGSGSHATTTLCLEWLEGLDLAGQSVLDYGCGSGILGLAAVALGAESATLIDIDEQAISATIHNAASNGLSDRVSVALPGETEEPVQHDVLVANILSGTLIMLGPQLNGLLRPGARLALTGILADQADEVVDAWSEWADLTTTAQIREWVLLTGRKRSDTIRKETAV
jgi:ribosomal protein L11 methyltransferase